MYSLKCNNHLYIHLLIHFARKLQQLKYQNHFNVIFQKGSCLLNGHVRLACALLLDSCESLKNLVDFAHNIFTEVCEQRALTTD